MVLFVLHTMVYDFFLKNNESVYVYNLYLK